MNQTHESLTPAMRQYAAVKAAHPDKLVFFRMGDFYEMFGEDAIRASALLGITLTSRAHGKGERIPLAGVPYHQGDRYLAQLMKAGERVVVVEQVEDAKQAKGVVRREIVEILTPGTAPALLAENLPTTHWLASFHPNGKGAGIAALDLSTGEFYVDEGDIEAMRERLTFLEPAELLVDTHSSFFENQPLERFKRSFLNLTPVDGWTFGESLAQEELNRLFGTVTLDGFGLQELSLGIGAAGALVRYLRDTSRDRPAHIAKLVRFNNKDTMQLDLSTVRNLELVRGIATGTTHSSLFAAIDRTVTPAGARRLHSALLAPYRTKSPIERRQSSVAVLVADALLRTNLSDTLRGTTDLERLAGKIALKKASPRALAGLRDSLARIGSIRGLLARQPHSILCELGQSIPDMTHLERRLNSALVDDPPAVASKGGIFRAGFSSELDRLNESIRGARTYIASLQQAERERTSIGSLKVGYNQVFGYYLEVTRANSHLVPVEYIRKQTLVNAERYITSELKEKEDLIGGAEEKIFALELSMFESLIEELTASVPSLSLAGRLLAELDLTCSLAAIATEKGYARPELYENDELVIEEGRHPVVEGTLPPGSFVANSLALSPPDTQMMLLTGPNMAGKSTFLRQTGLIVILAQIGSFVPAKSARIGLVDRVFTRVGANDNLAGGQSTFLVEMVETANILHNATAHSLVLLDEIGRGTSTYDGLSVAWSVAEQIVKQIKSRTIFATHYHELTSLAEDFPQVKNYQVAVRKWENELIFLRQILPGGCDDSYGIEAARLAGIPAATLDRAREILALLESGEFAAAEKRIVKKREERQMSFFSAAPSILETELRALNLDATTPLAALAMLQAWKEKLDDTH